MSTDARAETEENDIPTSAVPSESTYTSTSDSVVQASHRKQAANNKTGCVMLSATASDILQFAVQKHYASDSRLNIQSTSCCTTTNRKLNSFQVDRNHSHWRVSSVHWQVILNWNLLLITS